MKNTAIALLVGVMALLATQSFAQPVEPGTAVYPRPFGYPQSASDGTLWQLLRVDSQGNLYIVRSQESWQIDLPVHMVDNVTLAAGAADSTVGPWDGRVGNETYLLIKFRTATRGAALQIGIKSYITATVDTAYSWPESFGSGPRGSHSFVLPLLVAGDPVSQMIKCALRDSIPNATAGSGFTSGGWIRAPYHTLWYKNISGSPMTFDIWLWRTAR